MWRFFVCAPLKSNCLLAISLLIKYTNCNYCYSEDNFVGINISGEEALVVEKLSSDIDRLVIKFDSACSKNMSGAY